MRGGVADYLERGGVGLFEELKRNVFGEGSGEVDDAGFACGSVGGVHRFFAGFERGLVGAGGDRCERLDARDDDRCGEARRDAGGDIEWCCAGGDFADGAVRKLDLDWVAHGYKDRWL